MNIRKEVMWFARLMEKVLRDNDDKDHWHDCTDEYLLTRINDEIDELSAEYTEPEGDAICKIKEVVDVANFAMMIADNARRKEG